ncbi:twin-arginine translocation signal domain-containing protein [Paraburkholderia sp. 1N]|jgi:isoquinoline 1-oxidoreductase beta subunit|uniref:Twin-arginine translocation signal domain-containing protein n=1 Tax=Paraburkholderia solitsugae TaxID=2675748 RepID=A0ABX2C4W7_9BURK|nr:twin-arginine translocation signal domain-containing protein [Paraburkholderia solitsugae]
MSRKWRDASTSAVAHTATQPDASRREFLKLGMTLAAAAGGGLLLGFEVPARGGEVRSFPIGRRRQRNGRKD